MTTFTPPPIAPSRGDVPATFISRMDAFLAWFATLYTELTAFVASLSLVSTTDTSATSNAIGTGAKTFTVTAGKSFSPGMYLVIADTAAPSTNSMYGQVTSYSGTSLVMNIISVLGSGTKTAWTISQSAAGGAGFGQNNFTGTQNHAKGAAVASAATTNIWLTDGNFRHLTGSATISSFGTAPQAGASQWFESDGVITLAEGANLIINGGGSNVPLAVGDRVHVYADTTTLAKATVWRKNGRAVVVDTVASASDTVSGIVELATSAEAAAGTDTVRAITPATLFGGLNATGAAPIFACRAWANFNDTGVVAIRASGNVSSITDNGVGDATVNFITALPDANYSVAGMAWDNAGAARIVSHKSTQTTTACQIGIANPSTFAAFDSDRVSVSIFR